MGAEPEGGGVRGQASVLGGHGACAEARQRLARGAGLDERSERHRGRNRIRSRGICRRRGTKSPVRRLRTAEAVARGATPALADLPLAIAVTAASLFGPLSASGIWDPHELRVADLSRRIALSLARRQDARGRGALEHRAHPGRARARPAARSLPWPPGFVCSACTSGQGACRSRSGGFVGIAATWALVARLADRAAAAFAALILATTPLYFLHARTILGDVVTMSGVRLPRRGLGLAVFDRGRGETARRWPRLVWLCSARSDSCAGFGARGLLIGVAVPAAGRRSRLAGHALACAVSPDRFGDAVGALALAVGLAAAAVGAPALLRGLQNPTEFSMLVGIAINKERVLPTFDLVIHHLGHGLFPVERADPVRGRARAVCTSGRRRGRARAPGQPARALAAGRRRSASWCTERSLRRRVTSRSVRCSRWRR